MKYILSENEAPKPADFNARDPMDDAEFQRLLGDAIMNEDMTWMGEDGTIVLEDNGENLTQVKDGVFAMPNAVPKRPSGHPEQWYNNREKEITFQREVLFMKKKHPNAVYSFYPNSGDMVWRIKLDIGPGLQPWTIALRYDKDHPHNRTYGGSIKVIPLNPSFEELYRQAKAAGRPGVPHILSSSNGSEEYRYLCTRRQQDVLDGKGVVSSAVMVAAWAAEWAANFQIGLKRKDVWNKFCGSDHFKNLQVP